MNDDEISIFDKIKREADPLETYINTADFERQSGTELQGPHPVHGSTTGSNFMIHIDRQLWHCFRCDSTGSIIDLVAMEEGIISCDDVGNKHDPGNIPNEKYSEIIEACCERFGIEYEEGNISEEKLQEIKKEREEKNRIFKILTDVAEMSHGFIDKERLLIDGKMVKVSNYFNGETIREHLKNKRGFSDEIIDELKIGFWDDQLETNLQQHFDKDTLIEVGILTKKANNFPMRRRIMYPYWKRGKVVYFIGRKTDLVDWESGSKYYKMRTGEKYDEVSDYIKNDVFYGEDNANASTILITEGVTDCISLMDAGFPSISPVTTKFRKKDMPKLMDLIEHSDEVIILNDNEKNKAGEKGALKTGKYLFNNDVYVKIGFPPRPEGVDKVDVDDYLTERNNSEEAVEKLINQSKDYIDYRIEDLSSSDYEGVRDLLELSLDKDPMKVEHILTKLSKETDFTKTLLRQEFKKKGGKDYKDIMTGDETEDDTNTSKTSSGGQREKGYEKSDLAARLSNEIDSVKKFISLSPSEKARYRIHIKDKVIELTQRQMLRPKTFTEYYLGNFDELLHLSKDDWMDVVRHINQIVDVEVMDKISDQHYIADMILENIEKGESVSSFKEALEDPHSYYQDEGVIYYASQHIGEIIKDEGNITSRTSLSYAMEEFRAGKSVVRSIDDKSTRFWRFERDKVFDRGEAWQNIRELKS